MIKFYKKLSFLLKIVFWLVFLAIFIFVGAVLGLFFGAMAVTFIPQCCTEMGCHSCLQINGLYGYEASGLIGLISGSVLGPLLATTIFIITKKK